MEECERCGEYFNDDNGTRCPSCNKDLCSECYNRHIVKQECGKNK